MLTIANRYKNVARRITIFEHTTSTPLGPFFEKHLLFSEKIGGSRYERVICCATKSDGKENSMNLNIFRLRWICILCMAYKEEKEFKR